jgi:hypothetical protein
MREREGNGNAMCHVGFSRNDAAKFNEDYLLFYQENFVGGEGLRNPLNLKHHL